MERRKAHSSRQLRTQHEKIKFLLKSLRLISICCSVYSYYYYYYTYYHYFPKPLAMKIRAICSRNPSKTRRFRGTLGGTQYRKTVRKIGNEIPCRKSAKYRYRIYDRSRLLENVSISLAILSEACMHQKVKAKVKAKYFS